MNLQENITRLKYLMGVLSEQGINNNTFFPTNIKPVHAKDFLECRKNVETKFTEAKNFLIKWISDPKTKEKFKKNFEVGQDNLIPQKHLLYSEMRNPSVDEIFNGYLELLEKIQFDFFSPGDDKSLMNQLNLNTENQSNREDAIAFVNKLISDKTVLINCEKYLKKSDQLSILIHEIQHLLFLYFPLNPGEKIHNIFNTVDAQSAWEKGRMYKTFDKILDGINTQNLMNVSQKYGIDKNILEDWFLEVKTKAGNKLPSKDGEITQPSNYPYVYSCNENEKMSNIMGLRSYLNISPTDNINYQDIIPFIKKEKNNPDAAFLIRCWALNGYIDIQKWISKMNLLALNKPSSSGDRNLA
jgi:hypothetical protein